ncbi:CopD family protein [Sulfitobacter sp. LCG007]
MRRLLILLAFLLHAIPQAALAHAQLRASVPAEGAVVDAVPDEIALLFSEPVSPLLLNWITPDGTPIEVAGEAENDRVVVAAPKAAGVGTHLMSWRIVSADGHPVGGTLTFHVGVPSHAPRGSAAQSEASAGAVAVLRFALTAALVLSVGGAAFAAFVSRANTGPAQSRLMRIGAWICLPFGVALMGAQGLDLLALPARSILTLAPWRAALAAPLCWTVMLSLVAAALSLRALSGTPGAPSRSAALCAWGLAAASFALSGHAPVAPPRWLTGPAIALHAFALIFWMGALLPLLANLRGAGAGVMLRRFSGLAIPLAALLILTGAALAWSQSGGDFAALAGSAYGALLGVKLALVTVLLALAGFNRIVLTPALAEGRPEAARSLRRTIRAELFVGLAVLALASGFRLTPPPRTLANAYPPLHAHLHDARVAVDMVLSRSSAGTVDIALRLLPAASGDLRPKGMRVTFSMPEAGVEPIRLEATAADDGTWHAGPASLPLAGDWQVGLRLLVTDFDSVTLGTKITLDP